MDDLIKMVWGYYLATPSEIKSIMDAIIIVSISFLILLILKKTLTKKFEFSKIAIPAVGMSTMKIPNFELPKIVMPRLTIPSLPNFSKLQTSEISKEKIEQVIEKEEVEKKIKKDGFDTLVNPIDSVGVSKQNLINVDDAGLGYIAFLEEDFINVLNRNLCNWLSANFEKIIAVERSLDQINIFFENNPHLNLNNEDFEYVADFNSFLKDGVFQKIVAFTQNPKIQARHISQGRICFDQDLDFMRFNFGK